MRVYSIDMAIEHHLLILCQIFGVAYEYPGENENNKHKTFRRRRRIRVLLKNPKALVSMDKKKELDRNISPELRIMKNKKKKDKRDNESQQEREIRLKKNNEEQTLRRQQKKSVALAGIVGAQSTTTPEDTRRKSKRIRRTPAEAKLKIEQEVRARRVSNEVLISMKEKQIIENTRYSVKESYLYPPDIAGTFNCQWRAIYNIVMDDSKFRTIYNQLQRRITDPNEIREVCVNFRSKEEGKIFHLMGYHWVSLTKEFYTDDGYRYKVNDYEKAVKVLGEFEYHGIK